MKLRFASRASSCVCWESLPRCSIQSPKLSSFAAMRHFSTSQWLPSPHTGVNCCCSGHAAVSSLRQATGLLEAHRQTGLEVFAPTRSLHAPRLSCPFPVPSLDEWEKGEVKGRKMISHSQQHLRPPRGSGIQPLLDNNKLWAEEMNQLNPNYFADMAARQEPQYLWIGCSDSRVPANELIGLYPGDVFVHRNVGNVVCNSDLNVLAVVQYAVDCLKVEHVIVSGHYNCGAATAALYDTRVGLADHWILHLSTVKKRHWKRMQELIPTASHLSALCELNVLAQVENVVETHLIQRVWRRQNDEERAARMEGLKSPIRPENEVCIHGWVYDIETGHIKPLLSLDRHANTDVELKEAQEALFLRYSQQR